MTNTVTNTVTADAATVSQPRTRALVRSGLVVAGATGLASVLNYASNVVLGHGLDMASFGDASLIVSAVLVLGAFTTALQLAIAGRAGQSIERRAVDAGLIAGVATMIGSVPLAKVFHMGSPLPIAVLGLAIPVSVQLAVSRGRAQAAGRFGSIAASFVAEATARFGVSIAGVAAGFGATSAALALGCSFVAGWGPVRRAPTPSVPEPGAAARRALRPLLALAVAQVVIGNGDLWIVKVARPAEAGMYAAVALVGRLVVVASTSVVTVTFPSLGAGASVTGDQTVLARRALAVTAALGGLMTLGAAAFGRTLLALLAGPRYESSATLLWPYALATTCFVIAVVAALVDIADGRRATAVRVMAAGAAGQTLAIIAVVSRGLTEVVWAQVATMAGLVAVMAPGVVGRRGRRGS